MRINDLGLIYGSVPTRMPTSYDARYGCRALPRWRWWPSCWATSNVARCSQRFRQLNQKNEKDEGRSRTDLWTRSKNLPDSSATSSSHRTPRMSGRSHFSELHGLTKCSRVETAPAIAASHKATT
jgi:hypothetical protein